MKAHFEMMAAYNVWANRRLYAACSTLSDEERREHLGAFFGGLHQTLNHVLVADVIWIARLRGQKPPNWPLDLLPHDDFDDLRNARAAMDDDISAYIAGLDAEAIAGDFTYTTISSPTEMTQSRASALGHFFNHQTHHRGQCHAMLTNLTGSAPSLDLIHFQRET